MTPTPAELVEQAPISSLLLGSPSSWLPPRLSIRAGAATRATAGVQGRGHGIGPSLASPGGGGFGKGATGLSSLASLLPPLPLLLPCFSFFEARHRQGSGGSACSDSATSRARAAATCECPASTSPSCGGGDAAGELDGTGRAEARGGGGAHAPEMPEEVLRRPMPEQQGAAVQEGAPPGACAAPAGRTVGAPSGRPWTLPETV